MLLQQKSKLTGFNLSYKANFEKLQLMPLFYTILLCYKLLFIVSNFVVVNALKFFLFLTTYVVEYKTKKKNHLLQDLVYLIYKFSNF